MVFFYFYYYYFYFTQYIALSDLKYAQGVIVLKFADLFGLVQWGTCGCETRMALKGGAEKESTVIG